VVPGKTSFKWVMTFLCPGDTEQQFLDIPSPIPVVPGQPPRMTYDSDWLAITRALHPFLSLKVYQETTPPQAEIERLIQTERQRIRQEGLLVPALEGDELRWERGEIDVSRVQKFWPTAPAQGMPGGSSSEFLPRRILRKGSSQVPGIPTRRPRPSVGCSGFLTRSTLPLSPHLLHLNEMHGMCRSRASFECSL